MTRIECERKLLSLAEQMRKVYEEYNPSGDFLTVTLDSDGYISIDDCYFNAEKKIIIDARGSAFRTVNVTKYQDGSVYYCQMV